MIFPVLRRPVSISRKVVFPQPWRVRKEHVGSKTIIYMGHYRSLVLCIFINSSGKNRSNFVADWNAINKPSHGPKWLRQLPALLDHMASCLYICIWGETVASKMKPKIIQPKESRCVRITTCKYTGRNSISAIQALKSYNGSEGIDFPLPVRRQTKTSWLFTKLDMVQH